MATSDFNSAGQLNQLEHDPDNHAKRVDVYVWNSSAGTWERNGDTIGGRYNVTQPTLTDGQRGDVQLTTRGALKTTLFANDSTTTIRVFGDNADGVATTSTGNALGVLNRNTVYNGTTWDRMPGDTTGINIKNIVGTVALPTGAATSAKQDSLLIEMKIANGAYAMQVDDTGTTLYQGWAVPGTLTSAASWRIRRVVTSGTPADTAITFADGNDSFDNIYNNRAALSYS